MKKGLSGDMILQIGIILIASITTIASVNVFYNAVEDAVLGDPVIAAKTLASYTDFVDSSNIPITIYHEIPTDFLGNPGYGTVLFNPTECEYTVSKYPQDYMSDMILNNAWDTVSIEEAVTYYALFKNNRQNRQLGFNRVQLRNQLDSLNAGEMSLSDYRKNGYGATVSEVNQYRQNLINERKFAEALSRQGIDYEDFKRALAQDIVDKEFTSKISETSANKARLNQELADAATRRSAQKAAAYELFLEKEGTMAALFTDDEFVRKYMTQEADRAVSDSEIRNYIGWSLDEGPSRADIDNAKASLVHQDAQDLARTLQDADDAYDNTVRTLTSTLDNTNLDPREISNLLASVDSRFNELDFKINPNADVAMRNIINNMDDDVLKQVSELVSKGKFDEAASLLRRSAFAHDKALAKVGIFKKLRNSVIDKKNAAKGKVIDFVKYVGKQTGKGIKAVTTKSASITYNYGAKPLYRTVTTESFRKTSETAAKTVSKKFSALATKNMKRFGISSTIMGGCRALIDATDLTGISKILGVACQASQSILAGVWYSTDVLFTYIPTIYFFNKAQKATEVVENSLVTISCNSGNKDYYVKVPNCESATDLYKPDLQIPYLGAIPGFDEAFMDIFTMPKSRSTGVTKNYDKIINSESACIDSHNKLLTGDKVDDLVNPREKLVTIPFFACSPLIGVAPDLTSACVTGWSILYLSSWADTEDSEAIALSLGGLATYVSIRSTMASPGITKPIVLAAIAGYNSALTAAYLLNPLDSTTFFPYISKSRGIIDDENNYYMENPFLIEISKREHNGKLVTEINKLV